MERKNVITMKGEPLTLIGDEAVVGNKAPEFSVLDNDLKERHLSDYKNKVKLIASVPSLDTPICDLQIKRFNEEATALSKDIVIIFISADLPFAQKRFCQSYDIKKVKTLSDHRDLSFGKSYGVAIKELRLLARTIFVINKENIISYIQYVNELSNQPDYEKALEALKKEV